MNTCSSHGLLKYIYTHTPVWTIPIKNNTILKCSLHWHSSWRAILWHNYNASHKLAKPLFSLWLCWREFLFTSPSHNDWIKNIPTLRLFFLQGIKMMLQDEVLKKGWVGEKLWSMTHSFIMGEDNFLTVFKNSVTRITQGSGEPGGELWVPEALDRGQLYPLVHALGHLLET